MTGFVFMTCACMALGPCGALGQRGARSSLRVGLPLLAWALAHVTIMENGTGAAPADTVGHTYLPDMVI